MTEKGIFQDGARRCIKPKEVEVAELFKNPLLSLFLIPIPPQGATLRHLVYMDLLVRAFAKCLAFFSGVQSSPPNANVVQLPLPFTHPLSTV